MIKFKIGYTAGAFDLFHIGHLNIIRRAKENCDYLIVGVSIDELVACKHRKAVIPFEERIEIVRAIKYVDEVVAQCNLDKIAAWEKYKFDVMFSGDDWKNSERWNTYEREFKKRGVEIVYFPYTKNTSSTLINEMILRIREE